MTGVIYARYSSDNQREESIEGQIRENTAFTEKNGIVIVGHYIDRAVSTKINNRLFFNKRVRISRHLPHQHRKAGQKSCFFVFYAGDPWSYERPRFACGKGDGVLPLAVLFAYYVLLLPFETLFCSHGKIPSLTECCNRFGGILALGVIAPQ